MEEMNESIMDIKNKDSRRSSPRYVCIKQVAYSILVYDSSSIIIFSKRSNKILAYFAFILCLLLLLAVLHTV